MKQFLALMVALLGAMTPALAFAAETADPSSQAAAALGFLAFGTFWFWVSAVAIHHHHVRLYRKRNWCRCNCCIGDLRSFDSVVVEC